MEIWWMVAVTRNSRSERVIVLNKECSPVMNKSASAPQGCGQGQGAGLGFGVGKRRQGNRGVGCRGWGFSEAGARRTPSPITPTPLPTGPERRLTGPAEVALFVGILQITRLHAQDLAARSASGARHYVPSPRSRNRTISGGSTQADSCV